MNESENFKIVIKKYADSFYETELEEVLDRVGVDEIMICGMMTHNCVTHTAISTKAFKYRVKVIRECCTTVTEIINEIALNALSIRVELVKMEDII